jgi:hypothetical protein
VTVAPKPFSLALTTVIAVGVLTLLAATDAGTATTQAGPTMFARPTIVGPDGVTVYGTVDSRTGGEEVTIQARDCGSRSFRTFAAAVTRDGGGWSVTVHPRISTTLRAVHDELESSPVAIWRRANVALDRKRRGGGFRVGTGGLRSFWHKRVLVQRLQGGSWRTVKSVLLMDSSAGSGYGSWVEADFTLAVPRGTQIRAVLPLSQATPCYLAGVSRTLRA